MALKKAPSPAPNSSRGYALLALGAGAFLLILINARFILFVSRQGGTAAPLRELDRAAFRGLLELSVNRRAKFCTPPNLQSVHRQGRIPTWSQFWAPMRHFAGTLSAKGLAARRQLRSSLGGFRGRVCCTPCDYFMPQPRHRLTDRLGAHQPGVGCSTYFCLHLRGLRVLDTTRPAGSMGFDRCLG
jgi:hypothetical protein